MARKRILFIGEVVTLSHVARPVVLASSLDPSRYEVVVACDPRYNGLFRQFPCSMVDIQSDIHANGIIQKLSDPAPLFGIETLERYIEEDLRLIADFKPALVVGDMRQSLMISSRLARVPYANVINAQWSPYATDTKFEMPVNPLVERYGEVWGNFFFGLTGKLGFAHHVWPINALCLKYGMFGNWDMRHIYCNGDYVLYADVPEVVPTRELPDNHRYIGPLVWSADVERPEWWERVPADRPVVYASLGSSGQQDLLSDILEAMADLDLSVLASTGSSELRERVPANAFLARYLPGSDAAGRADLVICNGGNMATQQALAAGSPVLMIVSNMDQLISARAVERAGCGTVLLERDVTPGLVKRAVWRLLRDSRAAAAAKRVAEVFRGRRVEVEFPRFVESVVESQTDAAAVSA